MLWLKAHSGHATVRQVVVMAPEVSFAVLHQKDGQRNGTHRTKQNILHKFLLNESIYAFTLFHRYVSLPRFIDALAADGVRLAGNKNPSVFAEGQLSR
jgi:hypothetical protein